MGLLRRKSELPTDAYTQQALESHKRLVFRRKSLSRKSAPHSRDLTYCWAQSAFFLYNILKYLGSQNEPIIIVCKCREEPLRKKKKKEKLSKGSDYSAVAEQHYPPHLLNCNRKFLE